MEMPHNALKRAIRDGKSQIGLWSSLSSNYSVEVIAGAGFDWILLDTEHSPNDLESVLTQAQAAAAYPTTSTVARVPWNDMVTIKRFLDIGIQTLLIPYVCSVAEAKDAVRYTRYPPAGVRGVAGSTRATRFGRVKDYAKKAQEEICVLVQVETKGALDQLEDICAVDGVDGVFIGPADLHASMGYTGEVNNPAVVPMIEEAMRRIRKCGKAPGVLAFAEPDIRRYIAAGALFTAVGSDGGILARGAEALAAKYKGCRIRHGVGGRAFSSPAARISEAGNRWPKTRARSRSIADCRACISTARASASSTGAQVSSCTAAIRSTISRPARHSRRPAICSSTASCRRGRSSIVSTRS